ncbi:MAG: leucine-rich repeat protein [Clostridiales bacterium]|nr:leucine-rich repeat protein [Candidatus Equinaster intestinalis]
MKKFAAIFLAVCLLVVVIPMYASAETSGTTGECEWSLDGTKLTISGNGACADYETVKVSEKNVTTAPWGSDITELIIEDGVTYLGNFSFIGCSGLTKVVLPDSIETVGTYLFQECTNLSDVTLSANLKMISNCMFYKCAALKSLTIPNKVETFGFAVFYQSGLESITFPDSVKSIGSSVFYNCGSLKTVTFGKNMQTIADVAFGDCTALESIVIPDSVTDLGTSAFIRCTGLKNVVLGHGVEIINMMTFSGCSNLESVTIPGEAYYVDMQAFQDCDSLTDVYYGGEEGDIYIDIQNEPLERASWHYNSYPEPVSEGYKVSGTVTADKNTHTDEITTVSLFVGGEADPVATTKADGTGAYAFENVAPGEYLLVFQRPYHAFREMSIEVTDSDISQDAELALLGDANFDGKVNKKDLAIARDNIGEKYEESNYLLSILDTDQDFDFDSDDITLIKNHIIRTAPLY